MDVDNLNDLRVVELKKELEIRGLSKSGSKKELVDRLRSVSVLSAYRYPRTGRCTLRNAEFLEGVFLRNFRGGTFRKVHLRDFSHSAFRKIQIKSNHQLNVGLGSHLSLESAQ